jgi:hypothetical protein
VSSRIKKKGKKRCTKNKEKIEKTALRSENDKKKKEMPKVTYILGGGCIILRIELI